MPQKRTVGGSGRSLRSLGVRQRRPGNARRARSNAPSTTHGGWSHADIAARGILV